jgi:hypothetical protein
LDLYQPYGRDSLGKRRPGAVVVPNGVLLNGPLVENHFVEMHEMVPIGWRGIDSLDNNTIVDLTNEFNSIIQ